MSDATPTPDREASLPDRIEKLCIDKGLRMTEQRRTIARVLSMSDDHPDAEELHRRASAEDPRISLATVYRTVRLFEAAGNYPRLYFEGEEPLIHRSLSYLEERLDPGQYFRASRQHIFNLDRVEAMNSRPNGKLIAHLSGDLSVELSHRRSRTFREERSL